MALARKDSYAALHAWSVAHSEEFWNLVWDFCGVIGQKGARTVVDAERMPGARWFPDAKLNFAENLLRRNDDTDALVFWGEDKARRRMNWRALNAEVSRLQQAFRAEGLRAGDRVAAYMPNMPETIIAMLAASSLGAVFTSCSPDFGVQGILDRFGQIEPKFLIGVDGYHYGGKTHSVLDKLAEVQRNLPSLKRTILVPYAAARS